ncbi:MAG: glycoside hydrolase family 3 protein, partial [Candidatus Hydrogenedentes bacterium]|nr:glycoside hydrolase family 3 protein [Candidatus Hydrogenedentota bacterium]
MKRKTWYRGASASLMVTFILGVGVGAGLCYAGLELMREDAQQAPSVSISGQEGITAPIPEAVPMAAEFVKTPEAIEEIKASVEVIPVETTPSLSVQIDPDTVWPIRHLIIGFEGTALSNDVQNLICQYLPGGIWIRERNVIDYIQLTELILEIRGVYAKTGLDKIDPLIFFAPESRLDHNPLQLSTALSYKEIAEQGDFDAIKKVGFDTANAAIKAGIDVLLAPPLNVYDAEETDSAMEELFFGNSAEVVAHAGLAYAEGLMEGGAIAVAKDYPGSGTAIPQRDGILLLAETDVNSLVSVMMPFAEAAAHDIHGLLVGAIAVPALDVSVPGRPAFVSPILVDEALRNQWGYEGVIISDDILLAEGWSLTTVEKDILAALSAGCDAVMISATTSEDLEHIVKTVIHGIDRGTLREGTLELARQKMDLWRQQVDR